MQPPRREGALIAAAIDAVINTSMTPGRDSLASLVPRVIRNAAALGFAAGRNHNAVLGGAHGCRGVQKGRKRRAGETTQNESIELKVGDRGHRETPMGFWPTYLDEISEEMARSSR